ncbi:MAG: DNA recombination/repair protein RecA, partial [Clostridiales bacterium]|nr:DNA recombination/repair protein RecA [Clostridiales bacterium]
MAKKESKKEKLTLSEAIAKIEKDYGKGSVMKLGENKHMKIDVISSGILSLDLALGVGGYPKGRIVE